MALYYHLYDSANSFSLTYYKKLAIKIKNKNKKKVTIIIFNKILHVIEKKIITKTSPFFYE